MLQPVVSGVAAAAGGRPLAAGADGPLAAAGGAGAAEGWATFEGPIPKEALLSVGIGPLCARFLALRPEKAPGPPMEW